MGSEMCIRDSQNLNFTEVFLTFSIAGHVRPGWAEIRSYLWQRSQHSTCLASQQSRCLGSQQGTISLLNTGQNLLFNDLSFSTVSLFQQSLFIQQSLYSTASLYSPVSLYSTVSLDSGQVFFLGKIKACLACNKPNIKDKIPSKVTSDGLK